MQSVHYCETQATLSIAIIAKRINNGISLVLALVAIMAAEKFSWKSPSLS